MKLLIAVFGLLSLASCVANIDSAKVVLSEPNDSASIGTLTQQHELFITENRILVYNEKEQFEVPAGQMVVFESDGSGEPVFTLMDKDGRHFQLNFDF